MTAPRASHEFELKFLVPASRRAHVQAEMARPSSTLERHTLTALYLDTPDRRLAAAGLSWRMRREGRRWVQTLKASSALPLARFEHEVLRPGGDPDANLHAGTPAGDRLLSLLADSRDEGVDVVPRFEVQARRTSRRVRSGRTVVEIAHDEGRITADGRRLRLTELEFEHVAGPEAGVIAVARRWQRRFGLVLDPRSKSERGDRLADGKGPCGLRKARTPDYGRKALATEAFGVVFDECMSHLLGNAIGLVDGDPALRVEHVHQLRVAIRRLRSALVSFRPWIVEPPAALVDGLRHLFAELGRARDADVRDSGVVVGLRAAGAPPLRKPVIGEVPDPAALIRDEATQQLLLGWLEWRLAGIAASAIDPGVPPSAGDQAAAAATEIAAAGAGGSPLPDATGIAGDAVELHGDESWPRSPAKLRKAEPFAAAAARRLRRWHRRIVAAAETFESLDDAAVHELRKRIKKQRYAVEFFSPALKSGSVRRYLKALASVQEHMGELNDLVVARDHYQSRVDEEPAAWFALGWLAARIGAARQEARPRLKALASCPPPRDR